VRRAGVPALEAGLAIGTQLGRAVELAPPLPDIPVEGLGGLRVDSAAENARASMYWAMRTELRVEREQVSTRSGDGEHHRQLQLLKVHEQPPPRVPRPGRSELWALREEHRFTSSGIGRPQLQRWKRRPRRVADAIAARAPASPAALTVPPFPEAAPRLTLAARPTAPRCPESFQEQSEDQSPE